jgi:23S rRNA (guanosine2251-2'-O)-methyltransferase
VLELLRARGPVDRILIASNATSSKLISEIRRRADSAAIPLRVVPPRELERVAGELNHQGIVALTSRYRYAPFESLLSRRPQRLLFLDGVMDPHNLGSLIRSAEGAGFEGVVIPARRAAGVSASVRRTSAGASELVEVARVGNVGQALDAARRAGLWTVGLDAAAEQEVWSSTMMEPPVGLVLGSENRGLSKSVRSRCDGLVRIPQLGRIGSLNVSVAGAVAMFEVARRSARSATL